MPGLIRGVARTAVVAGTASAVSGRVHHRQQSKWAAKEQQGYQQQGYQQQAYQQQPAPQVVYAAPPAPAAPAAPAGLTMEEKIAQLEGLAKLKEQGILSEAEFEVQKAAVLNG